MSSSMSHLLCGASWAAFRPSPYPTADRKQVLQNPALLAIVATCGAYKTLDVFHEACLSHVKIYPTVLTPLYQDLEAAGFPPKDSEAWRTAAFPTEEEWAAKEARRLEKHIVYNDEALVECITRASEFARMNPDRMVKYLKQGPCPLRWRNITALVDRKTLEYVENQVQLLRYFEESLSY